MPSIELGLEVTQNLKLKKRKKKGVKKNKLVTSVVACNSNQGDIFGCNNDDGSHSNEFLSASIMTDQDHNSHVPSTVFNAGISVKLKKKNKKGGFKESKMVVDNVKDNQNQLVDETNNIICGKDENARFKDNGDNADKLQEYSPPNCEKDLSVLKESKKIEKVKVQACKIQDKSINNDSISQDIVLAPTPSLDLKSKLHNEKQVVDSSVPKEKGKQKKRKLMTNKIYDKSTPTETITVLAVPAYSENSKPVADTSALKEKGKLKKRKLETSRVPENPL